VVETHRLILAENLLKAGYAPAASVLQHTLAVADTDFNWWRRGGAPGVITGSFSQHS
jgi:hypothetical protein